MDLWEITQYLSETYDLESHTPEEIVTAEKRNSLEDFRVTIGRWRDLHWDEKIDDKEFDKKQRETADRLIEHFKLLDGWLAWKSKNTPSSGI